MVYVFSENIKYVFCFTYYNTVGQLIATVASTFGNVDHFSKANTLSCQRSDDSLEQNCIQCFFHIYYGIPKATKHFFRAVSHFLA